MESSASNESNKESYKKSPLQKTSTQQLSFSDIMRKRWQGHLEKHLSEMDVADAKQVHRDSGQAEFAQSNYLMLRNQDELNRIYNYFDPSQNKDYQAYLQNNINNEGSKKTLTRS